MNSTPESCLFSLTNTKVNGKKCTTLVCDVDIGGSCDCVRVGGLEELSAFSAQFYCEAKTALKIVYLKRGRE